MNAAASQNIVNDGIRDETIDKQQEPPPSKKKKSPYRGVYYNRAHARFEATFQGSGTRHYLGSHKLAADCALLVDEFFKSINMYERQNFSSMEDYEKARALEIQVSSDTMQDFGSVEDVLTKIQKQLSHDSQKGDKPKKSKKEKKWDKNYRMLKEFKKQNGHCNVPQGLLDYESGAEHMDFPIDVKLSLWVSVQRAVYRKNELPAEHIELLEDIGFVWNAKTEREIDTLSRTPSIPQDSNVTAPTIFTMKDVLRSKTDTSKEGPTAITERLPIEMCPHLKTASENKQEHSDKTNVEFGAVQLLKLQAKEEEHLKEVIKDQVGEIEDKKLSNHELDQDNKVEAEKIHRTVTSRSTNLSLEEECKHLIEVIKQSELEREQLRDYVESYKATAWQSVKELKEIIQKMLRSGCEQNAPSFILKEHSKEIMDASTKYGFNDLRSDAEAFYMIHTSFTVDTVIDELLYAHSSNFSALKQASIDFIINHIDGVLESKSYVRLVLESKELTKEIMRAASQSSKK